MPVPLFGQPADMDPILALAKKRGLIVIEDSAQAHGAMYGTRRAGSLGHAGAFSFYPGKNLGAYGDGGMIVTNDPDINKKLRRLRNYGQRVKYEHDIAGTNSRLDTTQAAILRVKLRHLDRRNAARQEHAVAYHSLLADAPLVFPQVGPYRTHVPGLPGCPRNRNRNPLSDSGSPPRGLRWSRLWARRFSRHRNGGLSHSLPSHVSGIDLEATRVHLGNVVGVTG
jgi:hypothetical protein